MKIPILVLKEMRHDFLLSVSISQNPFIYRKFAKQLFLICKSLLEIIAFIH